MARLSVLGPRTRRKIHTDFLEGKLRFGFWSCKGGAWYLVLGCDESKIGLRFSIKLTLKGRAVGAQGPKRGGAPGPRGRSKPRRFGSSYPGPGRSKPRPIEAEAGPGRADRSRGRSKPRPIYCASLVLCLLTTCIAFFKKGGRGAVVATRLTQSKGIKQ